MDNLLARGQVPEAHRSNLASRHVVPIGAEAHRVDLVPVWNCKAQHLATAAQIPQVSGTVEACRCEALGVGRERDTLPASLVPKLQELLTGPPVEHASLSAVQARREIAAAVAYVEIEDSVSLRQSRELRASCEVPDVRIP